MTADPKHYVTSDHLQLLAMIYIRQSTIRQVRENTESAHRQYGLHAEIEALGWASGNIRTIDSDQGHSGASATGRGGFQQMMSEVAMGHVGLVASLEVSRLSRDNADWSQLVKVCALTGTLLMDENSIYDPRDRNDRLLLGIKGNISETERLMIRDRLLGAAISLAKRGAFRTRLPAGFIYGPEGNVLLDPDQQVQQTIRHFFETFRRVGSARATIQAFRQEGLLFPHRDFSGPHKTELRWVELSTRRTNQVLHNPRYAGAYTYGRYALRQKVDGRRYQVKRPREQWISCIRGAHEGYIDWEEFERNEALLRENNWQHATQPRGAAREGPALLQGLAICGACGHRMTQHYRMNSRGIIPVYQCRGPLSERGEPECQTIFGDKVDEAVGNLLVEMITPAAVAAAMEVHQELQAREGEARRLRHQAVDRARYEVDVAHRRYLLVDPENRLVAATLERAWNERIQALAQAEADFDAAEAAAHSRMGHAEQAALQTLPRDFAALWRDPRTSHRDRKRMARLIIEDVTLLNRSPELLVSVNVRFKGGMTRSLTVPRHANHKECVTTPEVIREVKNLAPYFRDEEIAQRLNQIGLISPSRMPFNRWIVRGVRLNHVGYRRDTRSWEGRLRRMRQRATPTITDSNIAGAV